MTETIKQKMEKGDDNRKLPLAKKLLTENDMRIAIQNIVDIVQDIEDRLTKLEEKSVIINP